MAMDLKLPDHLRARVESIAARSNLSTTDVLTDALENGHSLAWQEALLETVAKRAAAADAGDFASGEEVARTMARYSAFGSPEKNAARRPRHTIW